MAQCKAFVTTYSASIIYCVKSSGHRGDHEAEETCRDEAKGLRWKMPPPKKKARREGTSDGR